MHCICLSSRENASQIWPECWLSCKVVQHTQIVFLSREFPRYAQLYMIMFKVFLPWLKCDVLNPTCWVLVNYVKSSGRFHDPRCNKLIHCKPATIPIINCSAQTYLFHPLDIDTFIPYWGLESAFGMAAPWLSSLQAELPSESETLRAVTMARWWCHRYSEMVALTDRDHVTCTVCLAAEIQI